MPYDFLYPVIHGDLASVMGKWGKTAPESETGAAVSDVGGSQLFTIMSKLGLLLVARHNSGGGQ